MIVVNHFTPYFEPTYYGSHERYLSETLARQQFLVRLITTERMPKWGGASQFAKQRLPCGAHRWAGCALVRIPACFEVSFVPLAPSLYFLLRKTPADIYLAHEIFSPSAFIMATYADRNKRPFFLIQHGYHGGRRIGFRALFRLSWHLYGRRTSQICNTIFTLTSRGALFLTSLGIPASKICVVPTGVNVSAFTPKRRESFSAEGTLRVGFLGRVQRNKGIFDLLRSLSALANSGMKISLDVVGGGDDLPRTRERAAECLPPESCTFFGPMSHSFVTTWLPSLDVLCVPTQESEPFGIVAAEAAAAGVPVVATRVGGLAETVLHGETGMLCTPKNSAELSTALRELGWDRDKRIRMGRAARARAESTYSWDVIAGRFADAFRVAMR